MKEMNEWMNKHLHLQNLITTMSSLCNKNLYRKYQIRDIKQNFFILFNKPKRWFLCSLLLQNKLFGLFFIQFLGLNAMLNWCEIQKFWQALKCCNFSGEKKAVWSRIKFHCLFLINAFFMFYLFIHFLPSEAWSGPQKCFTWFCKKKSFRPIFFQLAPSFLKVFGLFWAKNCWAKKIWQKKVVGFL